MTSIDICNSALLQLGQAPINGFDQGNIREITAELYLEPCKRELLRKHDWSFASERATLAQLSETPEFGWDYAYRLPVNCLAVRGVYDDESEILNYKIEQRKILCDEDTEDFQIRYTKDIDNYDLMDPIFTRALIHYLAYTMAMPVKADKQIKQQEYSEYLLIMSEAKDTDSIESQSAPELDTKWEDAGR